MNDLRDELSALADRAAPADLLDRVYATSHRLKRRRQALAAGVAGSTLLPGLAAAVVPGERVERVERIGLQLYTVRRALAKDLDGTLAAIAAAGVRELEFAGYYNKTPAWWRAA